MRKLLNDMTLKIIDTFLMILFVVILFFVVIIINKDLNNKEEFITTKMFQAKGINNFAYTKNSNVITVILEYTDEENKENLKQSNDQEPIEEIIYVNTLSQCLEGTNTNAIENNELEKVENISEKHYDSEEKIEEQQIQYESIGNIEIPKTEVNLPILSNVTVEGMEVAPCKLYSTGELNVSGNTLIVGHNYRNNTLFSNNGQLQNGDKIYITTSNGNKVEYTIYSKFITTAEDVSYLKRQIGDKPEISLQCCSNDDEMRIIVLAIAN